MTFVLSFCYILFIPQTASKAIYDVTTYGAKGDGYTDDTNAFLQAWAGLCNDASRYPTLVIPQGKSFLIGLVTFNGPCRYPAVNVELWGNIIAPNTLSGWNGCEKKDMWISFSGVHGLSIYGHGQINGRGSLWWGNKDAASKCERPKALHFNRCDRLRLIGTTHIDSPSLHISIINSQNINLGYLRILAPANSPNTDGIDISYSSNVLIHDSNIQTGDDCVAINGGIYNLNVTKVFCGPGHGISIGSLGENGGHDTVENVHVQNCNLTGTTNGLRIKTVEGGTGYARGVVFEDITMVNVQNPIIINQHYQQANTKSSTPSSVHVYDVKYLNIHGSSATKQAITFDCSKRYKCYDIYANQVGITGPDVYSYCNNAKGEFVSTNPTVRCS
ncbi:putative polygalacturonase At3g15720 [Bidens hawaiensis]|uniref:putative polygalacturonase At3g15720 n=1 Tax=Bidens hawaiensis TaxID=980011 RepID=UPI00404B5AEF